MRRDLLILTFTVIGCVLLLQIGCREKVQPQSSSAPQLMEDKTAIKQTKSEIASEPNEVPEITFETVIHDFGEVGPASDNVLEFRFTNTGDGLLKVRKKIESSCGCTVPQLKKQDYAPGESGTIKVKYHAGKRPGSVTRHLFVHSNDKSKPKVKLTIKARITPKVGYKPEKLNLSLRAENAACPDITLTSIDNKLFVIKQFKSTANVITADFDPSEKSAEFILKPKVDIEKLRKNLNGKIEISISHPEYSEVVIGFRTKPEFELSPGSIIVLRATPKKPVKKQLWILSNYGEDFEVESTESQKGLIKVLSQQKIGTRYKFELEITPPAKSKTRTFKDVFIVKLKTGQLLKVPCHGFYAHQPKSKKPGT